MVQIPPQKLTLAEILASPQSNERCEFVDGEAIPKVSPKRFHAGVQKALIKLLDNWAQPRGHFYPEWGVILKRRGQDWAPIPDLTYISFERLSADWLEDAACPVPPDLAIEIISPDQTFGEMTEKATDYLTAGVLRVWIIDPKVQSITVFAPDSSPITYRGDRVLSDRLFSDLQLTAQQVFQQAGLSVGDGA